MQDRRSDVLEAHRYDLFSDNPDFVSKIFQKKLFKHFYEDDKHYAKQRIDLADHNKNDDLYDVKQMTLSFNLLLGLSILTSVVGYCS